MNAKAARYFDRAAGRAAALENLDPREQWTAIADDMIAGRKADPEATQQEIADRMGQSQDWVSSVLRWRTKSYDARRTPFARDDWDHRKQQIATQTPVKQADRVKMAEKLLEDPKVVKAVLAKSTVASRGVTNAVAAKGAEALKDKTRQTQEADAIKKASLTGVEGRLSTMITKINEWALALDSTRDDIRDVRPSRQTELLDRALDNLARAAEESRLALGYPSKLRVVESTPKRRKQLA